MTTAIAPRMRRRVFYQMADILPEGKIGSAEIQHFTVGDEPQFRALLHPQEYVAPGDYCKLLIDGSLYMSDTPMEMRTNIGAVIESTGRVVIGGLGMGLIVLPILAKPDVTHVTVIEKNPDVIALVAPALREHDPQGKLVVEQGDVFTWEPTGAPYDYAYMDIWRDICADDLTQHKTLRARYRRKKFLAKGGKVDSWQWDHLRRA